MDQSKKNEQFSMPMVPMGDCRTLFVPLSNDGKTTTALGFFVKYGEPFSKTEIITTDKVLEHVDGTVPVVAFDFKSKKSINSLIKFLRVYRDEIYEKEAENE